MNFILSIILLIAEQLQAFEVTAKQMLEDVQERLVFRTNIHIRDDILGYKPAPGDLAYPEKLQMMEVYSMLYLCSVFLIVCDFLVLYLTLDF